MAKANNDKDRGDEKFNAEDKKLAEAITMNITGTEYFKLCQEMACAFTLLSLTLFRFAVRSE